MPNLFRGPTIDDAREAAKTHLGDSAVFLEERLVRRPGVRGLFGGTEYVVEAAQAPPPPPPEPPAVIVTTTPKAKRAEPNKPFARGVYEEAEDERPVDRGTGDRELNELRQEVRHMRAMIHRLTRSTSPWKTELSQLRRAVEESRPAPSAPSRVRTLLERSGLDGRVAASLSRQLKRHADDPKALLEAYRDALVDRIEVAPWPLADGHKKVVAVVGPPGVGKTTTIAKIAARAIGDFDLSVTLVAADIYRVAAIDQLARYAQLLGAHLEVAASADELHDIVAKSPSDLVLVDTSGRAPTDEAGLEAALAGPRSAEEAVIWGDRERHVLLCLPAALRSADAGDLTRAYGLTKPTSVAITKIDLTTAPGGLLIASDQSNLPISTLCTGQRVPEDISPASAGAILGHLAADRTRGSKS